MTDLFNALKENRKSAISSLKCIDSYLVEFDDDKSPFVLIEDGEGTINDLAVTKVCLNDNNEIDLYIEDWNEWVSDDICLSTTANNVYEAIEKQIFGD